MKLSEKKKQMAEIIEKLEKAGVNFEYHGFDEKVVVLRACEIGDNFYDYGDEAPDKMECEEELKFVLDNPLIYIKDCSECCGCAGW